jgi:hypothetical protein
MKDRGALPASLFAMGYIVAQWGDLKRVDMTFSTTKSYLSTVAGLAHSTTSVYKGVDDRVGDYVTDETYEGAHNLKHLDSTY